MVCFPRCVFRFVHLTTRVVLCGQSGEVFFRYLCVSFQHVGLFRGSVSGLSCGSIRFGWTAGRCVRSLSRRVARRNAASCRGRHHREREKLVVVSHVTGYRICVFVCWVVCVCWVVQRGAGGCQIRRGVSSEVSAFRGGVVGPAPADSCACWHFPTRPSVLLSSRCSSDLLALLTRSSLAPKQGARRERGLYAIPSHPVPLICCVVCDTKYDLFYLLGLCFHNFSVLHPTQEEPRSWRHGSIWLKPSRPSV